VVRIDGLFPYTVIRGKDGELYRSIAVYPELCYLFIGDWSSSGRIFRTNLDGSNKTKILRNAGWTNGITIDYEVGYSRCAFSKL